MYEVKNGLVPTLYMTEFFNTAPTVILIFHVFAQRTIENILYDILGPLFGTNY